MNRQILFNIFEQANRLEAQGRKLIKLHVGQPDQNPPALVIKALEQALDQGLTGYGSAAGHPELVEFIAKKHHCQPKNILLGPGSKWLIQAALKQLIRLKKPEIIIFQPSYSAYELIVKDLGGKIIPVSGSLNQNWQPNLSQLKQKLNHKTAAIILNSPNNPTSTVIKPKNLTAIHRLAEKHQVPILHDWAYFDLSFSKLKLPKLTPNHLHLFSFSKSFSMTGFRLGFILASAGLIADLKTQVQLSLTCIPPFIQHAGLIALANCQSFPSKLKAIYQKRVLLAQKILKGSDCRFVPPQAGFYLFIDLKQNAEKFTHKLLNRGVVVVPGTAFGPFPSFIRISLTQPENKLKAGLAIIKKSL